MTDTVNVDLTAVIRWLENGCAIGPAIEELKIYQSQLAAAPKAEPVEADDFGDALLAFLFRHGLKVALDVSEIEALRQSAIRAQPEAPKVEQEPVAWRYRSAERPHLGWTKPEYSRRSPYGRIGMDEQLLFTHPAPASDELLEALADTRERILTWPIGDHEHCMCGSCVKDHDIGSGHSPVSMGDHAVKGIVDEIDRVIAKHKGLKS